MAAKSKSRHTRTGAGGLARPPQAKARPGMAVAYAGTKGRALMKSQSSAGTFRNIVITYVPGEGVGEFVEKIRRATPMELVEIERIGVGGRLLKDMAKKMAIPSSRFFNMIGVPKATAEKKASTNEIIAGAGGQAAIGMVRLLGIAQSIVDSSTADVRDFDVAKWLGQWIERPQPALGGKKPAELLDTPTGVEIVSRVLGAVESGAYL